MLVRDSGAIPAIQSWHAGEQPGAIVLLPVDRGPGEASGESPLKDRLYARARPRPGSVRCSAAPRCWSRPVVRSAAPTERYCLPVPRVLPVPCAVVPSSRAWPPRSGKLNPPCTAPTWPSEPPWCGLAEAETSQETAGHASDHAREAERLAIATREDAIRLANTVTRELAEADTQLRSLTERIDRSERRLQEIDAGLTEGDLTRARLDEHLGLARAMLADLETQQEAARDARVHWQVQEAQLVARLESAQTALDHAQRIGGEADHAALTLAGELAQIEADTTAVANQQALWIESRAERRVAVNETGGRRHRGRYRGVDAERALTEAEQTLHETRTRVEQLTRSTTGWKSR